MNINEKSLYKILLKIHPETYIKQFTKIGYVQTNFMKSNIWNFYSLLHIFKE